MTDRPLDHGGPEDPRGGHSHDGHRHLYRPWDMVRVVGKFWSSSVNRAAVELLDPRPGEHVLDLGAGLGPAVVAMARRVGSTGTVVAIDPSSTMRTVMRLRRLTHPDRRRITIRSGSGEKLPVADGAVDAVISLNVMHHLDDPGATARELHRVFWPGGRLLLVDEDFGHRDHTFSSRGEHDEPGSNPVDPGRVAAALSEAGFTDVVERHGEVGGEPAFIVTAIREAS